MSYLKKQSGHITRVQDLIIQSPHLHWSEKLLYYAIRSLVNDRKGVSNGEFEASKESLARSVGLSVRTIQRLLKKWRESGYLAVKEANRFKPVKYEFVENALLDDVLRYAKRANDLGSVLEAGHQGDDVGQPVSKVSRQDVMVGLPVIKVGHSDTIGKTDSHASDSSTSENSDISHQSWRTPEKDQIVREMGRKMNEISSDISGHFVVDEKWLHFLTREEYNRLVKISGDLRGKTGG